MIVMVNVVGVLLKMSVENVMALALIMSVGMAILSVIVQIVPLKQH